MFVFYPLKTKFLTTSFQTILYIFLFGTVLFYVPTITLEGDDYLKEYFKYYIKILAGFLLIHIILAIFLLCGILLEVTKILVLWTYSNLVTSTLMIFGTIGSSTFLLIKHFQIYTQIAFLNIAILLIAFLIHTHLLVYREIIRLDAQQLRDLIYKKNVPKLNPEINV